MDLIYILIIGGIAGWLASTLMKGRGMGIIMNIILGILGALVGEFLLPRVGIHISGLLGEILRPTIGAIVVLFLAKTFAR